MEAEQSRTTRPDPNDSPFELPPIEGIPFDKDSEEARAIERILAWGEPELTAVDVGAARHADAMVTDVEIVFTVSESAERGFEASAVGHSIYTQAESFDELRTAVQDAVRCHFEEADRPTLIRLHVVRDEVIPA